MASLCFLYDPAISISRETTTVCMSICANKINNCFPFNLCHYKFTITFFVRKMLSFYKASVWQRYKYVLFKG